MIALDRDLLDTYRAHATETRPGTRTSALTAVSGLSPTRTYQRLVWLLTDPQAWEHDPVTMRLIASRVERGRPRRRSA